VTVRFLVEAEAELDFAVAHYEAQLAGLGTEFVLDVRAGLARIEEFPRPGTSSVVGFDAIG
jgi:hypothetical protein